MRGKSEASEQRDERDKEIQRLRLIERWTMERIAREFGLTRQRVHQIMNKAKKL